jgi:carboxylesterase type B
MSGRLNRMVLQSGQWHRTKAEAVKAANKLLERVKAQQRERLEELESVIFTDGGENGTGAETDR